MTETETYTDRNGTTWPVRIVSEPGKLISFGVAGHVIHFGHGKRLEGYETPESFFRPSRWWAHDYATREDPAPWEGVAWVDKRDAIETDEGYRWVFRGPMVNVDLPPGGVHRCPDLAGSIMAAAMIQDGGTFGALLTAQEVHRATAATPGPLDDVDVETYLAGWKAHGARVGHIRGGLFVED